MNWLQIWIRRKTLLRAIAALLFSTTARHEEAIKEMDAARAASLRAEADADANAHNELWTLSHSHGAAQNMPGAYYPSMARAREHSNAAAGGTATGGNATVSGVPPNLFWVNTVISTISLILAIVASCGCWWLAKENKQTQIQLMYSNALLLRAGIMLPGDFTYGPEGNLEYKPRPKQEEKK